MLFNSFNFLLFFPIVVLCYYIIPARFRNLWLLLCSYYFYMNWNARYALLLGLSTLSAFKSIGRMPFVPVFAGMGYYSAGGHQLLYVSGALLHGRCV